MPDRKQLPLDPETLKNLTVRPCTTELPSFVLPLPDKRFPHGSRENQLETFHHCQWLSESQKDVLVQNKLYCSGLQDRIRCCLCTGDFGQCFAFQAIVWKHTCKSEELRKTDDSDEVFLYKDVDNLMVKLSDRFHTIDLFLGNDKAKVDFPSLTPVVARYRAVLGHHGFFWFHPQNRFHCFACPVFFCPQEILTEYDSDFQLWLFLNHVERFSACPHLIMTFGKSMINNAALELRNPAYYSLKVFHTWQTDLSEQERKAVREIYSKFCRSFTSLSEIDRWGNPPEWQANPVDGNGSDSLSWDVGIHEHWKRKRAVRDLLDEYVGRRPGKRLQLENPSTSNGKIGHCPGLDGSPSFTDSETD